MNRSGRSGERVGRVRLEQLDFGVAKSGRVDLEAEGGAERGETDVTSLEIAENGVVGRISGSVDLNQAVLRIDLRQ